MLARKRREYQDMVPEFYDVENTTRTEDELGALRQVGFSRSRGSADQMESSSIHAAGCVTVG